MQDGRGCCFPVSGTGEYGTSRRRLIPAALGWAGSHPGNTLDLCRGYRDWLGVASTLQTTVRVDNALHPPRMQASASLGGPRAAPETFLLQAEKIAAAALFLLLLYVFSCFILPVRCFHTN